MVLEADQLIQMPVWWFKNESRRVVLAPLFSVTFVVIDIQNPIKGTPGHWGIKDY
jgi:hypothetical protein